MLADSKAMALLRDNFSNVIDALSRGERRFNGRLPKRTKKVLFLLDRALGGRRVNVRDKSWQIDIEEDACNG
jgi:hypothetical protein